MMGIQAKITFTSLNDTIVPVKRVITLDSQVSKITVSRASKSSSKSLYSAGDNAWFDSPVMSRDHAEISLDPECETLLLRDVGSMHGTSINNTPLVSFVPNVLHNGDVVVFGAEVKRGSETFPPCKFIVNYEISSQKAGNTFSYPEYSDYEDDDDISLDDSDIEQNQIMGTPNERTLQSIGSLMDSNILPSMETDIKNLSPTAKNDNVESTVSETKNLGSESQSSRNSDSQCSTNSISISEARPIKATQVVVATDKPIEKSASSDASSQITEIETGLNFSDDKCYNENKAIDPSKCKLNEFQKIKCRKRKADVISGNSEDEGENCATNSFPTQDTITSVLVEPSHKEIVSSTYSGVPPSKRQKIIESLGYVALGGFAAATGLFSVLVATAPDFS